MSSSSSSEARLMMPMDFRSWMVVTLGTGLCLRASASSET
jgi:hypothetical protein